MREKGSRERSEEEERAPFRSDRLRVEKKKKPSRRLFRSRMTDLESALRREAGPAPLEARAADLEPRRVARRRHGGARLAWRRGRAVRRGDAAFPSTSRLPDFATRALGPVVKRGEGRREGTHEVHADGRDVAVRVRVILRHGGGGSAHARRGLARIARSVRGRCEGYAPRSAAKGTICRRRSHRSTVEGRGRRNVSNRTWSRDFLEIRARVESRRARHER